MKCALFLDRLDLPYLVKRELSPVSLDDNSLAWRRLMNPEMIIFHRGDDISGFPSPITVVITFFYYTVVYFWHITLTLKDSLKDFCDPRHLCFVVVLLIVVVQCLAAVSKDFQNDFRVDRRCRFRQELNYTPNGDISYLPGSKNGNYFPLSFLYHFNICLLIHILPSSRMCFQIIKFNEMTFDSLCGFTLKVIRQH